MRCGTPGLAESPGMERQTLQPARAPRRRAWACARDSHSQAADSMTSQWQCPVVRCVHREARSNLQTHAATPSHVSTLLSSASQPPITHHSHNSQHASLQHQALDLGSWQHTQVTQPTAGHTATAHHQAAGRVLNPAAWIMGAIKQSRTPQELLAVLQRHQGDLNMLHASAAITHTTQLQQQGSHPQLSHTQLDVPTPAVSGQAHSCPPHQLPRPLRIMLLELQLQHMHAFGPRQIANSLWALSKLLPQVSHIHQQPIACQQPQPQQDALQSMQATLQDGLLQRLTHTLGNMNSQELTNTWYALATLAPQCAPAMLPQFLHTAQSQWHEFKPQELAMLLWATARMPGIPVDATWAAWVTGIMQAQVHAVDRCHVNDLSCSLWAGAQLCSASSQQQVSASPQPQEARTPQPVDTILQPPVQSQSGTDTSSTNTSSLGDVQGSVPPVSLEPGRDALSGHRGRRRQQPVNGGMHVLGTEQQQPATVIPEGVWLSWSLAACVSLQHNTADLGGPQIVQVLSALTLLPPCQTHRQLASELLMHAAGLAATQQLSPRAASSILHAAAQLGLQLSGTSQQWVHSMLQVLLVEPHRHSCSPLDTAMALHALAVLRCNLSRAAVAALMEQVSGQLSQPSCGPGHVAMMLWACSSLRLRLPPYLLASFQKAVHALREQLQPAEMTAVLWALGQVGLRPAPRWMHDVLGCVCRKCDEYQTHELLQVLAVLGRLRHTGDAYDKVVAELQRRFAEGSSTEEQVAALCAVARAQPAPCSAVRWAQDLLLPELLTTHLHALQPVALVRLLWASARLARLLPHQPPSEPAAILVQHPQQLAAAVASVSEGDGPAGEDTTLTPTGSPGDDSDSGLEVQLRRLPWRVPQATVAAATGVAMQARSPPAVDRDQSPPAADNDAQDVLDALAAGLPAKQLLEGTKQGKDALLLQWQALQRRPGRLMLPEQQVCALLRACVRARKHLSPQQLAVMLAALPRLNIRPSRTWMRHMLFNHQQLLTGFSHHELALTLFTLGCMRMQPPEDWMRQCQQQVLDRAPYLNASMVSGVLRGLSLLSYSPGPVWMSHFLACAVPALRSMPPRQLAATYAAALDIELSLAQDWGFEFSALTSFAATEDASISRPRRTEDAGEV